MKSSRFDDLALRLATSFTRRTLVRVLGLGAVSLPGGVNAKKKRKRKVHFNEFGCVDDGKFCKGPSQCCSGSCFGKFGRGRCRTSSISTCQGQDSCAGEATACMTITGAQGKCVVSTGKASYCVAGQGTACFPCRKDTDCFPYCGFGASCIVCAECAGTGLQTACASPTNNGCVFS